MIDREVDRAAESILDAFSKQMPPYLLLAASLRLCTRMLATMTKAALEGGRPDLGELALLTAAQMEQVVVEIRKRIGGN